MLNITVIRMFQRNRNSSVPNSIKVYIEFTEEIACLVICISSVFLSELKLLLKELFKPLICTGDLLWNACWRLTLLFGEKETALKTLLSDV